MSHLAELNCGPMLYECIALPTELRWHYITYNRSQCAGLNRGPHPYHGCALPTELHWLLSKNSIFLKYFQDKNKIVELILFFLCISVLLHFTAQGLRPTLSLNPSSP